MKFIRRLVPLGAFYSSIFNLKTACIAAHRVPTVTYRGSVGTVCHHMVPLYSSVLLSNAA